jgi:hypothetical protein|tara:strand:+ start:518 stop:784 length:267 start_codon:yes stop_codon:yes gene_type:complete
MATTEAILRAIQIINSNAQISISGNDLDSITWENGTSPISKSDIEAKISQAETEIADAAAKKIADKASADAKLKILGLTDDEIEAFRG